MKGKLNRKSLVFDFDGTLIDISLRDYRVYKDILSSKGFNYIDFAPFWQLRRDRSDIRDILRLTDAFNDSFFSYFLERRASIIDTFEYLLIDKLFPYSVDILTRLQENFDCYLVTSRINKLDTQRQIDHLNIRNFFKEIFITSGSKRSAFQSIPNIEFVIGDTENDISTANELNIKSYAVTTGIRSPSFLKALNPTLLADDLYGLIHVDSQNNT